MAGDKKTHSIYLIDIDKVRAHFELAVDDEKMVVIESIMEHDRQYQIQELKDDIDTQQFSIILYFRADYVQNNKFSLFCSRFVKETQDAVTFHPSSSSSVMFIWNNDRMYAITTGQGYRMVENYAVPKFGLIIATAYEQYFKVTSLQSSEMSSIIHSSQTIYTTEVPFQSVDKLDTVFKEIGGRINNNQLVHNLLNLEEEDKKNSMRLKAKDYAQFGSSLDFNGLLHLLQKLNEIDINVTSDGFNTITQLTKKKNSKTINAINEAIIDSIYSALINGKDISFELFHQDTDSFIFADRYEIYYGNEIYSEEEDYNATVLLKNAFKKYLDGKNPDGNSFKSFILKSRISTYREDKNLTDGSILSHIFGEVEIAGKSYFVLDGKYYLQTETYVNRLNTFLERKLQIVNTTDEIKTNWLITKNKKEYDEDWFNQTVSQEENYIQLHKVIPRPEWIEFADLIKFSEGTLSIVHVKDGFDGEMRVLDRQVEMSIRMWMDIKYNNDDTFMRKLYKEAVKENNRTNISSYITSEDEFVEKIKNSKPRYVIVIRPPKSANNDLLRCQSTSAKHCLNALIDRCFRRGIELKIQIKEPVTEVKK